MLKKLLSFKEIKLEIYTLLLINSNYYTFINKLNGFKL